MAMAAVVDGGDLQALIDALRGDGRRLLGPTVRDGAVVHAEITSESDLPAGVVDEQEAGRYRLHPGAGEFFGAAVGPQSWKPVFFAESTRLLSWRRDGGRWTPEPEEQPISPLALIGVRACDLAAIAVQDRVLLGGDHPDPAYAARRGDVVVVAVNCTRSVATCFCRSMGTGPQARSGYDLALTEVLDDRRHHFVVDVGTDRGANLLEAVPHRLATEAEVAEARGRVETAGEQQRRHLDPGHAHDVLSGALRHPRWEQVAQRCLSCGNCTMVCPTCFCSEVEDVSDLDGQHAERRRVWDSCFSAGHSYIHGGSVRASTAARYRQWLTHKLSTWVEQFGTSGCVGCGRCIAWCPVGIDITEEVAAIAATPAPAPRGGDR